MQLPSETNVRSRLDDTRGRLFVTRTCSSRMHGEPCRFMRRRKRQKQLGSVSSLCVPCNNSLLNPRCPSVRPYGTTTRRFKTKHTLHTTHLHPRRQTRGHTCTHTHLHARSHTVTHTHRHTRARNSCIENSRSSS